MIKYPCINTPAMTYSGKEFSPLGLGISAEGHDIGVIMTGRDTIKWIVKLKNNRKVWVRYEENINKMVHEEQQIKEENNEIIEENNNKEENKSDKKQNNYIKYLSKRKVELKQQYENSKTSKEIFNQILQEWKELKENPKKMEEVFSHI